jgi:hypothetical protein
LAGKLEKAIGKSLDEVDGIAKELALGLDWQVRTIQEFLRADSTDATKQDPARSVDGAEISAAADRLRELLEANDADAPEAYADFAELLHGTVDGSRLSALGAAVNAFDFQTALVKLHEIASP